jgi:uncharacterized protein YeaO (DUF488 family)
MRYAATMAQHAGTVRIKRVYEPATPEDGTRVLVDRVWPRGISRERAAIELWLKEVAPSTALRKRFGHDPARWTAFSADYRAELGRNEDAVGRLLALAKRGTVTLVFSARDEEHNQAVVLARYLDERLGEG